MTTAKDLTINSVAEPATVKIERNSKGYNHELSYHGETTDGSINTILAAKARLELELYGSVARHNPDAHPE